MLLKIPCVSPLLLMLAVLLWVRVKKKSLVDVFNLFAPESQKRGPTKNPFLKESFETFVYEVIIEKVL